MRFILSLMIAIGCFSAFAHNNDSKSCSSYLQSKEAAQERLIDWLGSDSSALPLDTDPTKLSSQEASLRRLFVKTEPQVLESIFQILSKDDVIRIFLMTQTNELQVTEKQKNQLSGLVNFIKQDPHNVLWDEDGVMSALTTKYPEYRGPGHRSNLGGVIGGLDTSTITSLEKEIVDEALRGASPRFSRGNWVQRFWSPQYFHVSKILNFFNWIRSSTDRIEEVGSTLRTVLNQAKELKLADAEVNLINEKYNILTVEQRKKLRKISEDLFGQDIFTGGYQSTGGIRLKQLAKKISNANVADDIAAKALVINSEMAFDLVHKAINDSLVKQKKPARTLADYYPTELKVRHEEYDRKEKLHHGGYLLHLSAETKESVHVSYKWDETEVEVYTDADGKTKTRTKVVTYYGSGKFNILYSDIIVHKLTNYQPGSSFERGRSGAEIVSVDGLENVAARVDKLMKKEGLAYKKLKVYEGRIKKWIEEKHIHVLAQSGSQPQSLESYLAEISAARSSLNEFRNALMAYAEMSREEVLKQWPKDNYEHFQLRMKELNGAAGYLLALYDIYQEQVRRKQYELVITPDLPDYSKELNKLRWALIGNIGAKIGLGANAALHAIACSGPIDRLGWTMDAANVCVNSIWGDMITTLLSYLQ